MSTVGIESILYIIGVLVSLFYIYVIRTYNIKKRKYEEFLFITLIVTMLLPLIMVLYSVITLDFRFSYIFQYTFSRMSTYEILISTLYSYPIAYFMTIYSVFLMIIRFRYVMLNRSTSRKAYIAYPIFICVLFILYTIFPSFTYFGNKILTDGQGPYPYLTDPILFTSLISLYISIVAGFFSSSYYIVGWIHKETGLESFSRKMIYVMGIFSSLTFILRTYFLHIHYVQNGFFSWNIVGFLSCLLLIISLLYIEILSLRGNRILGSLPYTSYVTLVITIVLTSSLNPENIGTANNLNFYKYILIIILVSVAGIVASGTEIFKRFFLPWDDDSTKFLERFPSIMGYIIASLIGLFLILNISIYSTLGGLSVSISRYYHYYLLATFGLSPTMSLVGSLISKFRNRLNIVSASSILILIAIYALVLVKGGLETIFYIMVISSFLSIPVFIYVKRLKGFPLARILLITILLLFLLGLTTYNKSPIKAVNKGSEYDIDGVESFTISDILAGDSDMEVYKNIDGNTTIFYKYEKVILNDRIVLEKFYYPVKEFTYFRNYYLNKLGSSYFICISSVAPQNNVAYLYNIKVTWSSYQYIIIFLLMLTSLVLMSRDNMY